MNTAAIGRRAEQAAALYLHRQGYKVIDRNWRTRWCEIDLVAVKGDSVTLVEVKYRRHKQWGTGLEYISRAKHKQMCFAAEFWQACHDWRGPLYVAAIEVEGAAYEVTAFIPEL